MEENKKIITESDDPMQINAITLSDGKTYNIPSTPSKLPKEDAVFLKLQKDFEDCSNKVHSFFYTTISVAAAVPILYLFKTMKPLYIFPVLGGAVDFYRSFQYCKDERRKLDIYLFKKRKYELECEKRELEMEKQALMEEIENKKKIVK
ncbi:hypothetical protein ABK040_004853 [Willaertia magna]